MMATPQRIRDLITAYADGPRALEEAVAGIPEDERHFTPGPEHWTIHENVVHIADSEIVGAARMRYVIAEPGATLVSFDQTAWATALGYRAQSFDAALLLFRAIRGVTAEMLRRAPAEAWEHTGLHSADGPQTLEWLVEHFAEHVPYHQRTIAKRRLQFARAKAVQP